MEKRKTAIENTIRQNQFALSWKADTTQYSNITFKGYEAGYKKSAGNRSVRFCTMITTNHLPKQVKFYDVFTTLRTIVEKPFAYVISSRLVECD